MDEEFIAQIIAELFDVPCNYSPCEDELHDTGEHQEWCDKHCGKCSPADCWMHYFQIRYTENENN